MIIVGITGLIGSGKSTTSLILKRMGYNVFDADKANKTLLNEKKVQSQIINRFKKESLINEFNKLNLKELSKLVFSNEKKLKELEQILHPKIQYLEEKFIIRNIRNNEKIVFLDVPLLFKNNRQRRCDYIIYNHVNKIVLKQRLDKKSFDKKILKIILNIQKIDNIKFHKFINFKINSGNGYHHVFKQLKTFIRSLRNKKKRERWPITYMKYS